MASTLPTDDAGSKSVLDFGIGPYDGTSDGSQKGEDDESREPRGKSIPDGGAADDRPMEYYLSYPQEEALGGKHASADLPGDLDRAPRGPRPQDRTIDDMAITSELPSASGHGVDDDQDDTGASQLPHGGLPVARSDYYDRTVQGASVDQIWPSEDSGAYTSSEPVEGASELPTQSKNEQSMDDFLGSLGNAWQGYVKEDISGPYGFPAEDFLENADFEKSNDETVGKSVASFGASIAGRGQETRMNDRTATDVKLVSSLTTDFVKKFGKKNIVRRHVLAFLQDAGLPQYLASDIVRCLKHQHKVVIPDVMDTFPLAKVANDGRSDLGAAHRGLIGLWARNVGDEEVSSTLMRCASRIGEVLAELDRLEVSNGR